ncbi:ABC transporter ATP-binding protein [bacterium]|nr:ABC transporter ATP-binding protein [bacterium]MBT4551461.1 ABC transporter ATP-binding protein [bacterium]MBT5988476.1 ABC transporter ATP-binding protein [bacterium]
MIKLKKVSKNIKVKGEKQVILHNINLEIEKGEFVSIMGPVGSGKSTLLSIMGLMHTGYNGEYYLDGQNMNDIKSREMSEIRNKKIGFIGQEAHLLGKFNILENIELPLLHKGHSAFKRNKLILSFLKDTHLRSKLDTYPIQISSGEKQLVIIARALADLPELILADNPTNNLDHKMRTNVLTYLQKANDQGSTVVIVTHEPQIVAASNRILNLDLGRLKYTDAC